MRDHTRRVIKHVGEKGKKAMRGAAKVFVLIIGAILIEQVTLYSSYIDPLYFI
jgi:hypothetical protein